MSHLTFCKWIPQFTDLMLTWSTCNSKFCTMEARSTLKFPWCCALLFQTASLRDACTASVTMMSLQLVGLCVCVLMCVSGQQKWLRLGFMPDLLQLKGCHARVLATAFWHSQVTADIIHGGNFEKQGRWLQTWKKLRLLAHVLLLTTPGAQKGVHLENSLVFVSHSQPCEENMCLQLKPVRHMSYIAHAPWHSPGISPFSFWQ